MANSSQSIKDLLQAYDKTEHSERNSIAEQERNEFIEKFPLTSWAEMSVNEYALGQPDFPENVCWYMEYGTNNIASIKGGSAKKHLIYKPKKSPDWYYPNDYGSLEDAWLDIRSGFVEMFELASSGNWEEIDEIQSIITARMLRAKLLHVYFPDEILPLASVKHIKHFLSKLEIPEERYETLDLVMLNRTLLTELKSFPELVDWTTSELTRLLYYWTDPRETRKIYKIAPGEKAFLWPECLENGYICVGWNEIGDLNEFDTYEEFFPAFSKQFSLKYNNHNPAISKKAKELWTLREINVGDLIVANKGISEVLAIGEVIEPIYEFIEDSDSYQHIIHVNWDTSIAKTIPPQKRWGLVTIAQVGTEFYNRVILGNSKITSSVPTQVVDQQIIEIEEAIKRKGQAILYGPPGTGKTYHARRFAKWWLLKENEDVKVKRLQRRVWWAVANPKQWSWDELFTDGAVEFDYGRVHKNFSQVKPDDLVIGYQANPDKKIMALAEVSKGVNQSSETPQIELRPLVKIPNGPTYQQMIEDVDLKNSEPLRNRCQGRLFSLSTDEAYHLFSLIEETGTDLREYQDEVDERINAETFITFHPSYSYEDFIEGYRPVETSSDSLVLRLTDGIFKQICREAVAFPNRKYLLIIDEVNRANVSKVFGELITLLEIDKRDQVIVLPQSKELFQIPPNVFILATMNTSDRSIKLLDTALRRRFAFLELMPDYEPLRGGSINNLPLDDFLKELNSRIAKRDGREKQIGHAYLMDGDQPISDAIEFQRRFVQEILPLLQEYCYEDYGTLSEYLGNKIVDSENQTLNYELLQNEDYLIEELLRQLNKGSID